MSEIHTVLVSSDRDRITRGPVTYSGPGQYPDPILGPFFELVQHETRVIQFDNLGLGVGATALDDLQPVVGDPSVGAFSGRRFPRYQYGCWADRLSGYIARRSPGDCITFSCRKGKKTKQGRDVIGSYRPIVPDSSLRLKAESTKSRREKTRRAEFACHETQSLVIDRSLDWSKEPTFTPSDSLESRCFYR